MKKIQVGPTLKKFKYIFRYTENVLYYLEYNKYYNNLYIVYKCNVMFCHLLNTYSIL